MKLIKSSYEILPQALGLAGVYKQIEIGARTCYRSEDAIKDGSAEKMAQFLKERGHHSPLEHGTVYLAIPYNPFSSNSAELEHIKYRYNPYSKINNDVDIKPNSIAYVTTNLRVLIENCWEDDLKYLCEPTEFHEKRYSVRFVASRAILDEFMRHRMSISCESSRYCNYSKDKFGSQLTFVIPEEFNMIPEGEAYFHDLGWRVGASLDEDASNPSNWVVIQRNTNYNVWLDGLDFAEKSYLKMIKLGFKPQVARGVLPLDVKSECVITGFTDQWMNFFKLRTNLGAHPDARAIAIPLYEEFLEKGYITPIE